MSHRIRLFIIAESILYILFLTLDLMGGFTTTWLKYAGILLCVCIGFSLASTWSGYLTAWALLLTAAADLFLLVLNRHYTTGLFIFCLVQLLYCLKLSLPEKKCPPWELGLRIGLPSALIFLLWLFHQQSLLNALAAFYFCNLVFNAFKSFRCSGRGLFTTGLFLFIGCDICVGLFNLDIHILWLKAFVSIAMWAFYLPSQVLITLSIFSKKERSCLS
ncbi:MAG: hypothetical protein ACOX8H_13860 [Ruminococcus sp.]|jgi:hypothetical protein